MEQRVGDGQAKHWQQWHISHDASDDATVHAESVDMFCAALPKVASSHVLELGCGQGYDAVELALRGYDVTGADFSSIALRKARQFADATDVPVKFCDMDLSKPPFPWRDNSFAGIFSYLSLHYFDDETTRAIFRDMHRITRPGGAIVFVVRSTSDPLFGQGEELSPHLFRLDGHVRRFFSLSFLTTLLACWEIRRLEEIGSHYRDRRHFGVFFRVWAQPQEDQPDGSRDVVDHW